ncbi:Alginate biosynthesis sensor protein KinB [Magnetococcus marinus MC-1]|uniref:histidine kinase n=1 Tax=Magnetococcus marinus (strain ATCC BAA-1437 / JCM 17883 / MC-1) TaxID=156889 RepID=A0LDP3_MAGMM|nr:sensor histidine kinase [Magnetococcus marinus]ABK46086.1 Alginate biosynthesis sensor protein KinB [Magnetococcus marinus MC-1]
MYGIRSKILAVWVVMLATVAGSGLVILAHLTELGEAVDVILRENYRSVIASQEMKEALERMDSGVLFHFAGRGHEGAAILDAGIADFRKALDVEMGNITLPGEQETAERLSRAFDAFIETIPTVVDPAREEASRRTDYFARLLPRFQEIKSLANALLEMNQSNMSEANDRARAKAALTARVILWSLLACGLTTILFGHLIQLWILHPIRHLTRSVEEIRGGNFDLVLSVGGRDEFARLASGFNAMAATIRELRRRDQRDVARNRQAMGEVFQALPVTVAIVDAEGRIEEASTLAEHWFGLKSGLPLRESGLEMIQELAEKALLEATPQEPPNPDDLIQRFVDGEERFFRPLATPIHSLTENQTGTATEPVGVAIILKDFTQVREQRELKRSVVGTVSHQLKTPLTALRMSLHLLLQEASEPLTARQEDLLQTARDESERMVKILDDLLDIHRAEAGFRRLNREAVRPQWLAEEATRIHQEDANRRGIALNVRVPADLPEVLADSPRLAHVFDNLLANALRHTPPRGAVTVSAISEVGMVRFLVTDSGCGVAVEDRTQVFEPFWRGTGQCPDSGVGLGLTIVREIVRAHNGEVGVAGAPGGGAVFTFTLPAVERPPARPDTTLGACP